MRLLRSYLDVEPVPMENGPEATISTGGRPPPRPPPRPDPLPPPPRPRPLPPRSEGDDDDGEVPDGSLEEDPGSGLTCVESVGLRRCGITGLNVILDGPAAVDPAAPGPGPLVDRPRDGTILIVGLLEARLPPGVELLAAVGVDAVRAALFMLLPLPNIGFGTGRLEAGGARGREREGAGADGASLATGGTPSPAVLALSPFPAVPFPLLIVGVYRGREWCLLM